MKEAEVTGAQFTDVQMVTHDNSLITDAQFAGAQLTRAQTDTQDDSMITGAQVTGAHFTGAPEAELLNQKHLEYISQFVTLDSGVGLERAPRQQCS